MSPATQTVGGFQIQLPCAHARSCETMNVLSATQLCVDLFSAAHPDVSAPLHAPLPAAAADAGPAPAEAVSLRARAGQP